MITPAERILFLRVLALRNAVIGYEPHRQAIEYYYRRGVRRVVTSADHINWLARHYRRRISPELVPVFERHVGVVVTKPADLFAELTSS